jgi:hypothetical protein
MADEQQGNGDRGPRKRRDETAELTMGDLEMFEPPTGEIAIEDVEEIGALPPPPPARGMGRPRKEKRDSVSTLKSGLASPDDAPTSNVSIELTPPTNTVLSLAAKPRST